MPAPLITVLAITLLGVVYVTLPILAEHYRRYRYTKLLNCPNTGRMAEVSARAFRAAFSSLAGRPRLRVKDCTLWPRNKGCNEGCLR
jgi:hypothetical protein